MRRQDREDPAAVRAKEKAAGENCHRCKGRTGRNSCRLCHGRGWITKLMVVCLANMASDRAACRRRKAALPLEQYEAFIGAARLTQAETLAGLEVVGQSVSRKSRELVAAGIGSELVIIADLRSGVSQQNEPFGEGSTEKLFDES